MPRKKKPKKSKESDHHHVYVVFLRNPKGDGKAAYYVGMTGLSPEQRFQNHKQGIKAARIVRRCGERLRPRVLRASQPDAVRESRRNGSRAGRQPAQARVRRVRRTLMQLALPLSGVGSGFSRADQ